MTATVSPVRLTATDGPGQPTPTPELERLYRGFESELLVPLWTEIGRSGRRRSRRVWTGQLDGAR
jgi:gentisate 1,2-dioxygenase